MELFDRPEVLIGAILFLLLVCVVLYYKSQQASKYKKDIISQGKLCNSTSKSIEESNTESKKIKENDNSKKESEKHQSGPSPLEGYSNNNTNSKYSSDTSKDDQNADTSSSSSDTRQEIAEIDNTNDLTTSVKITKYASFPRRAESLFYFSDLTERMDDDSYFELRISEASGKAVFKPLDFMKIRNYERAMAVMDTEGIKPSAASIVLDLKPGQAHRDGKDWIIDELAKIKLA